MIKHKNIKIFNAISIKSKFLMMILSIAIICIGVVGFQGLSHGRDSLTTSMYEHLTSLKVAKIQQVEHFFQDRQNLMRTLAAQKSIVDAMSEFTAAYSLLDIYKARIDQNSTQKLQNFYQHQFIKKLNKHSAKFYSYMTMVPIQSVSQYLQFHYIVNNPFKEGSKSMTDTAYDESYYSNVHQKFHPSLRTIVKNQGFYDLFLIDTQKMNIIYSVEKEVDFATSLESGPYGHSSLAKIVQKIIANPNKGMVLISDFQNYKPSYNYPQAFLATPIYEHNRLIGILATQISIEKINLITTGNKSWQYKGLGKSGEVYLVGRDYKMRSNARGIIENPTQYVKDLNATNIDNESKILIANLKSTILNQKVRTQSVKLAQEGKVGSIITQNYLDKEVVSSYAPLKIEGLDWVIVAEQEIQEAQKPIKELQNALLVSSTILATLVTFYAIWLAYTFLRPIAIMTKGTQEVIKGETTSPIELHRDDEFGELSSAINSMITKINIQNEQINTHIKERDDLLLNILPPNVALKVKKGEKGIAESIPNVAVLFSKLYGFDTLTHNKEPKESITLLNELVNSFDALALEYGIEKITIIGDSYIAANGLIAPRLDYARRMVEYGLKMFAIIYEFNKKHRANLQLGVGIDSGEVMVGVVGEYKFVYNIWGEVVNDTSKISHEALPGTLRVSEMVYKQLITKEKFHQCDGSSEPTYAISLKDEYE